MSIEFDPYAILGLTHDATPDDIKAAYRRAARRLHPDVNQHNPGAIVQFQDITTSYELLLDERKRNAYLETAKTSRPSSSGFIFRVTPSKRAVMPLPESQVVYLLAEIIPDTRDPIATFKRESRLNLALILDRSKSMAGIRLEKVKVAAHQIIDQLTPEDIFSVVTFNDFGEVVIAATPVKDKPALKARVSMMAAEGSTEMFQGLSLGIEEVRRFLAPRLVNHAILLTDGATYGDEQKCLELAKEAAAEGISISAMGLGQDWNDKFLDNLASLTGGHSAYVNTSSAVVRFLNDHVRNLANVYAERIQLSVAPDPDITLESAFKLAPNPQPLSVDSGYIPLGSLQVNRTISVLLQLELPASLKEGFRSVARLVSQGDIFLERIHKFQGITDISLEVNAHPPVEDPPTSILDALGKLTLYRMQERAQEALDRGDVQEATRRLQILGTRLTEMGQPELGAQALAEARNVSKTSMLSEQGRKSLKYTTRFLLAAPPESDDGHGVTTE
ncbi:DnaJ domain-containing protein [Kamptonema cortianum]|nr:DnaJ domain-containing protein [Kamptonema cortianum]